MCPSGTIETVAQYTIFNKGGRSVRILIKGLVPERDFKIQTPVGDVITHGSNSIHKYSQLDYFLLLIPQS